MRLLGSAALTVAVLIVFVFLLSSGAALFVGIEVLLTRLAALLVMLALTLLVFVLLALLRAVVSLTPLLRVLRLVCHCALSLVCGSARSRASCELFSFCKLVAQRQAKGWGRNYRYS